jgi:diguanylate cyclase (GGDEF)-like protein
VPSSDPPPAPQEASEEAPEDPVARALGDYLDAVDGLVAQISDAEVEDQLLDLLDVAGYGGGRPRAVSYTAAEHSANEIVLAARRKGDEIVAAARRRAADCVDSAVAEASRTVAGARRAAAQIVGTTGAGQPVPPSTVEGPVTRTRTQIEAADDAPGLGRLWATVIVGGNSITPAAAAALPGLLATHVGRLRDAIVADAFTTGSGHQAGSAIVAAGIKVPEALGRTLEILTSRLAPDAEGETTRRVSLLMAALAEGFAMAIRDDVLAQQESLQLAAQNAARQIELSLRASESHYRRLALFDPLTGLPNRSLFSERLAQAVIRGGAGRHIGVCLIDLDGFKAVNDRFGDGVGDRVLTVVSQRLTPLVADGDYLLARLGGDEFAVLVEDCAGASHMIELAERVIAAIAERIDIDQQRLTVSASVGILDAPATSAPPAALIRRADTALRQAKTGRTGWALFDPRQPPATGGGHIAIPELSLGAFELRYQPLVGLAGGQVVGYEALARWSHPTLGRLDPDQVVDLTGDSDLAVRLSAHLLTEVCRQAARWNAGSQAPYVSVNLPLRHVSYPDIVAQVTQALHDSGLPPARLQLEIAENAAIGLATDNLAMLTTLAGLGVRLAIDDFGTGYTSLTYLRSLPVHELKLATSFLAGLGTPTTNHVDEAILTAMITLAHTIGLTIAAQGVDTDHHANRLTALRCDTAQGAHLGHPQPASTIP